MTKKTRYVAIDPAGHPHHRSSHRAYTHAVVAPWTDADIADGERFLAAVIADGANEARVAYARKRLAGMPRGGYGLVSFSGSLALARKQAEKFPGGIVIEASAASQVGG